MADIRFHPRRASETGANSGKMEGCVRSGSWWAQLRPGRTVNEVAMLGLAWCGAYSRVGSRTDERSGAKNLQRNRYVGGEIDVVSVSGGNEGEG